MEGIADGITELVGNTPMVFLNRVTAGCYAKVAGEAVVRRTQAGRKPLTLCIVSL